MSTTAQAVQSALIFIPDISGFTRFVTDVEIDHSSHIIQELLEILIESNDIHLEISEIEGDAILFYRFGEAPTTAELLNQVQKMFVNFHKHLKKYETHRICQCGACKTANNLTLKFIAHYGDITINTIKNHDKLFGKDVIVAHRLLKNDIEHHEYALITENLAIAKNEIPTIAWAPLQQSSQEYDSGMVQFSYLALAPLLQQVPNLEIEDYSIPGVKVPMVTSSAMIEAPLDMVFSVFADLRWRAKWIDGAQEEVDHVNTELFQNGATHRCLINGPISVSHDTKVNKDIITFTETDIKRTHCTVYTLHRVDEQRTSVSCTGFMKQHYLQNMLFRLFQKRSHIKSFEKTWSNLNGYCKALLIEGKAHHYRIVLDDSTSVAA